jgi:hypothetical protein
MRGAHQGGQNLTLSDVDLARCKPVRGEGGKSLRAFCLFHGSDNQRSMRVDLGTGRFHCFACGAWGYTEEARQRWREERARSTHLRPVDRTSTTPATPRSYAPRPSAVSPPAPTYTPPKPPPAPAIEASELTRLIAQYQTALPGGPAAEYLRRRGIPLEVAQAYGIGYAAFGTWAHKGRDWRGGRVVFPHTDPTGTPVNLYGRAVGEGDVPKALRHDHLPGSKGYFNARALREGDGPVFICEGPFDALSLIAAGRPRAVAIFGVHGWRWDWARDVRQLVFAFDADQAGEGWRQLARQARLRRIDVAFLTPEDYGGRKDVNEAWVAGILRVTEWPSDPQPADRVQTAGHDTPL